MRGRDWEKCAVHIMRWHRNGESIAMIAARCQVEYRVIEKLMKKWGVEVKNNKSKELTPRNERILALVDQGLPDMAVVRALCAEFPDITRGVVIGLRHRNGRDKSKGEIAFACRQNASRAGKAFGKSMRFGKGAASPGKTPPQPVPLAAPRPQMPATAVIDKPAPAPSGGRWVPIWEATGCRWVEGDVREGTAACCNAPTCEVIKAGDPTKQRHAVRYCAEHWHKRRAPSSRFTKVVA